MVTAAKTATPWGRAELVEQVALRQQAGERRFVSLVQLHREAGLALAPDGAMVINFSDAS